PPRPSGADAYSAERLAREQACHAQPVAALAAKGPGFETYSVPCSNGDALAIRCEFGNCRVLR
ncbi:MAG: glycine zipper family protein, partial [Diaphorobacter nitroreducens]